MAGTWVPGPGWFGWVLPLQELPGRRAGRFPPGCDDGGREPGGCFCLDEADLAEVEAELAESIENDLAIAVGDDEIELCGDLGIVTDGVALAFLSDGVGVDEVGLEESVGITERLEEVRPDIAGAGCSGWCGGIWSGFRRGGWGRGWRGGLRGGALWRGYGLGRWRDWSFRWSGLRHCGDGGGGWCGRRSYAGSKCLQFLEELIDADGASGLHGPEQSDFENDAAG
jgi:hypothetical protein